MSRIARWCLSFSRSAACYNRVLRDVTTGDGRVSPDRRAALLLPLALACDPRRARYGVLPRVARCYRQRACAFEPAGASRPFQSTKSSIERPSEDRTEARTCAARTSTWP
eukprot:1196118-Prorocentrum_minimum.AAC.3